MPTDWMVELYHGFLFLSPAFIANTAAVFVSGLGAIDGGKMFRDGKPILGKNKTRGGLIGAIAIGGLLGMAVILFFPEIFDDTESRMEGIDYIWYFGFILGFGAMVGDSVGSFIKRRVDLKPGGPFPVMDQVGFVIFASLIIAPFMSYPIIWMWLVIPTALILHLTANIFAYTMGWKDVWW